MFNIDIEKIKESIFLMIKLNCYKKTVIAKELGVKYQTFYSCITTCKNIETLLQLKESVKEVINKLNKKRYKVDWKNEIETLYLNGSINDIEQLYFYKLVITNFKQADMHLVDLYRLFLKSGLELKLDDIRKLLKEEQNDL